MISNVDIVELAHVNQLKSIAMYKHRQELEMQKIQILQSIQQTEMELLKLDGEEAVLLKMKEMSNGK